MLVRLRARLTEGVRPSLFAVDALQQCDPETERQCNRETAATRRTNPLASLQNGSPVRASGLFGLHSNLVVRSLYVGVAVEPRRKLDYAGLKQTKAAVLSYIDTQFENAST
jgi:hypothetical protein